jgi:lysophospholipase L1-like esterase
VINAGETGIDSSSIAAIVRQDLASLDVDLIIYYEGANEFGPVATMRLTHRMPPRPSISFTPPSAFEAQSDIARRAMMVWRSVRGGDGSEPGKPDFELVWPANRSETDPDVTQPDMPMGLDHIVANLESMRAAAAAAGGELAMSSFIWMVYPGMRLTLPEHLTLYRYLNEIYWPASYAHMRRMADYQNRVFHAFANRHGLEYFDVAAGFPRDPDLFTDGVHMTEDGLRLQAWMYLQQIVPLVERRIAEGRWPGQGSREDPGDRLRSHVSLLRRQDILHHCS